MLTPIAYPSEHRFLSTDGRSDCKSSLPRMAVALPPLLVR